MKCHFLFRYDLCFRLYIGYSGIRIGEDHFAAVKLPLFQRIIGQAELRQFCRECVEISIQLFCQNAVILRRIRCILEYHAACIDHTVIADTGGYSGSDICNGINCCFSDRHGCFTVIIAVIGVTDARDPAGHCPGIDGIIIRFMLTAAIAVDKVSRIDGNKRADNSHALILAVAASVNISQRAAVCDKTSVDQRCNTARLTIGTACFDGAGCIDICFAVDNCTLVYIRCNATDKIIAVLSSDGDAAIHRTTIYHSTLEATVIGIHCRCDSASIGACIVGYVDQNICEEDVFYNSIRAEDTEESKIDLILLECFSFLCTADGHTGDRISLTVKAAVERETAFTDGFPFCAGNVDVIRQLNVSARIINMLRKRSGKCTQLIGCPELIGGFLCTVSALKYRSVNDIIDIDLI